MAIKKRRFDYVLFLVCLFLGWFGIDKLLRGSISIFIIKLFLFPLVVGVIWNLYDIICVCLGRYKLNPFK